MATPKVSIMHLSEMCVFEFLKYLELSQERPSENEWSVDQMGHFNGWAADLGVFAQGHASVEYRLRHSPEIYQVIVQLIKAITANIEILLASLELPSDDQSGETSFSPAPSSSSSSSSEASTEILKREHLLTSTQDPRTIARLVTQARTDVQSSIHRLNRLSTAIRYAGTEVYDRGADNYIVWDTNDTNEVSLNLTALFAKYATRVVEDEIPKADPVLKQRISYAISRRHNRILYRKHRLEELAKKLQKLFDSEMGSGVQTENTGDAVSTSPQPASFESQFLSSTMSDNSSAITTNSEVSSTSQLLEMPKAPRVERGSLFLCPYCYIMLPYEDSEGTRWSQHVLRDLAPYVCIYPHCQIPNELYHDVDQWISHMQNKHLPIHWSCVDSSHKNMHFATAVEYKDHLRTCHSNRSDEDTLAALSDLNIQPGAVFTTCPFCDLVSDIRTTEAGENPASDQADLQKHIIHHLDLLSLFSLHHLDKPESIVDSSIVELAERDDSILERTDPISTIPFERDRQFVGRENILNQLDLIFENHPRAALYGLGGIGKSQIAIEYSYRVRERNPMQWVFWIHGGNGNRFLQAYKDLAINLEIPGSGGPKSDIPKLVCNWLERKRNGPWFMILDNVDDLAILMEPSSAEESALIQYIPHVTHGKILITSRDRAAALDLVGEDDKCLALTGPMDDNESLELIRAKLPPQTSLEDCRALSQAMEHIPLAMTQACAYINQNKPLMTASKYLVALYKSNKSQRYLLKHEVVDMRRDANVPNAVIATWKLSFTLLREKYLSSADLLSLMCMFDRQNIPEYLIHKENDDLTFVSAISPLINFSMIELEAGGKSFRMHRLVQLAIQAWLETEETIQQWKDSSIQSLSRVLPVSIFENWAKCQYLAPHAEMVLNYQPKSEGGQLARIIILYHTAVYLRQRGSLSMAEGRIKYALSTKSQFKDTEMIRTDIIQQELGVILNASGQWMQAEEVEMQVLDTRRKLFGQGHPDTLISTTNLASTYRDQGRFKEAEELELQALEMRKRVLGEEHPETLISTNNLASTYRDQGRFKEAEVLQVQVLEIRKRVLGQVHPDTLTSMNNLAATLKDQGRDKDAVQLMEQCAELREKVLGIGHPHTKDSLKFLEIWRSLTISVGHVVATGVLVL